MGKEHVGFEEIEKFLEGRDPQKYIVAIEAAYHKNEVYLIINDPETGKRIETHTYKPFLWVKDGIADYMYGGSRNALKKAMDKYGVTFKSLRIADGDGVVPQRMEDGFKYMTTCKGSYSDLLNFFKDGGLDVFSQQHIPTTDIEQRSLFFALTPPEQFLIATGKRLFKGMDDYNDVHRMQFDLETEGLTASTDPIFQIGIKDNKGFERVLEVKGNTPQEKRDSERIQIAEFFKIIYEMKPDIITAYNSEFFDWPYLERRCERLGIDITEIAKTLNDDVKFRRKPASLKVGSETLDYDQTLMWGINILDISHTVRKTMAINSNIKSWSLKYITKFSGVAKPNRVYVDGDKIHSTWADTRDYWFNDENGTYGLKDNFNLEDRTFEELGLTIVKGDYIVQRYLLDDLWETEQVDGIYNQAAYLVAKLLPTSYMRSSTMGTAGQWKLIMAAWSYEKGLGVPALTKKRDFTGGLSRLLEVGYAKNVDKFDYAALYPKTQLTWGIFPDLDISGVMEGLLTYIVDKRDEFKFLAGEHKAKAKELQAMLDANIDKLSPERIAKAKAMIIEEKKLASDYDKKQLPLKILANSFFGAYGAPYLFNWGDSDCAEETTCRGRQSLRLMVKIFKGKYGFRPLVGDSVTYDTPVYIRYKLNNYIDVLPICDLFNNNSSELDKEGFRDFEVKPFEVLTRNGWKDIKYVYRHETDKQIHRITTKDRLLNVTEDHSLFQNGKEVKPSELKRLDKIDTYEIPINNVEVGLNIDKAYLLGFFLGDGSANCSTRKQKYTSKKTGQININKGKRSDWKISNTNLKYLEKLKDIVEREFFVKGEIKNHIKSSGVYNLVVHSVGFSNHFCEHFYTSYREKKIPYMILNASDDIKKAFIEGVFASDGYGDTIEGCSDIGMKSQVAMAGISLLLKELDIEYKIKTRSDKQNFISFSLKNSNRNNSSFTEKTKKKTNEVWKNEIILNKDKNKFVYDISTEDGTFICGINGIIAHNTDGFNFARPDSVNDYEYLAKGTHWKTEGQGGKLLKGVDAVLAEFNETYMEGRMGLDLDDVCSSTINFARKNYANAIDGKVKLVGNTVKSNKMPIYIEEFLDNAVKMLLDGNGYDFINYYYEYVDKIYNYQIPLMKIASKAKVKKSVDAYKNHVKGKNKAGNNNPRQAHMELIINNNLDVSLGDTIYYVNTGDSKSVGDLKGVKDKETGKMNIELNCSLISREQIEQNPDLTTDDYNVDKYLDAFNKRIRPLLVCFSKNIRERQEMITVGKNKGSYKTVENILIGVVKVKDKITKKVSMVLEKRKEFTEKECELVAGHPYEDGDQDSYEDLMTMEDKEIRFWVSVNKLPNFMEQEEWDVIVKDYHERMAKEREDGIKEEKSKLDAIFQTLEVKDLTDIEIYGYLPKIIENIVLVVEDENGVHQLKSKKWDVILCDFNDMWKYEDMAKERQQYYLTTGNSNDKDRFEQWLDFQAEKEFMGISGKTTDGFQLDMNFIVIEGKHRKIGAKEWKPLTEPLDDESEEESEDEFNF